jgi:quinol monooxygenase YgiN
MRKALLACFAVAMLMVRADAQTVKPAVGSQEVYWVITWKVADPADIARIKSQILDPIGAATAKEAGSMEYEYEISPDKTTIVSVERFQNSAAALVHVNQTFPPFAKQFLAALKPVRFLVFGMPDAAVRKAIAGSHPVYMTPIAGFTK